MDKGNPNSWRATLTPHRSLSRRGFLALMSVIVLFNFAGGVVFVVIGAWPVSVFMGLDVVLIWWAFRASFAAARIAERIEITDRELIVERMIKGGRQRQRRFVRHWVQVELEEDRARGLIGRLFLASHGMRTEIGRFLSPAERSDFARELRVALAKRHI